MMMTAIARMQNVASVLLETTPSTDSGASGAVTDIFATLGKVVTGFTSTIQSLFTGVTAIFWNGTNLTFVGGLSLVGLGIGLFYTGFRFIRGLIKMRG